MSAGDKSMRERQTLREQTCPICGKPRDQRYEPFCSKRCADVDLHRWLKGTYRIPGADETDGRDRENKEDKEDKEDKEEE